MSFLRPVLLRLLRGGLAAGLVSAAALQAATFTWDGGGNNNNWGTNNNWNPNGAPSAGTLTDYVFAGSTRLTPTANGTTAWEVNSITFSNTASAFTLSGATLNLQAAGVTNNDADLQTIGNAIVLQATATFNAASGALSFTGAISGSFGVTKTGASNVTLSGTNTYTGTTTISGGNLTLGSSTALPGSGNRTVNINATSAGTTATLNLNGFTANPGDIVFGGTGATSTSTANIVIGTGQLILGNSTAGTGTVTYNATNNPLGSTISATGSGNVTLGTAARTFDVADSTSAAADLTISANIVSTNSSGSLVKTGAGNLVLSGTNTYTGTTTINNGTLTLGSSAALPASQSLVLNANGAGNTATLNLNGNNAQVSDITLGGAGGTTTSTTNILLGTGQLILGNATAGTGTVTYNATGNPLGATISATGAGNITLGTANRTFDIADSATAASDLTISANITSSGGGLIKTGTGTLNLTGATTYTGATTIGQGTLTVASLSNVNTGSATSLGSPTTVAAGTINLGAGSDTGTLQFIGATPQITDRVINLAGSAGSGGVLDSSGAGSLAFTSNLTATGTGAKTLTLTGTNAASAFGGAIVDGSGVTSLVKSGSGTWTLNGADSNTFTGTTSVTAGTLALAKTGSATALGGSIAIGGTGTIRLDADNKIATSAAVTFDTGASPTLNLNGYSQTLASIAGTNTAAQIQLGSPSSATTFAVGDSTSTSFSGSIVAGNANATFTKQGTGNLTLAGANSLPGAVNVNTGALILNGPTATLGSPTAVTVASGAALGLQGNATAGGPLTLAGAGIVSGNTSSGALFNVSGNNTFTGNLTLSSGSATVGAAAGTLTLGTTRPDFDYPWGHTAPSESGFVTIGNSTLTFSGSGNVVVRDRIRDFAGQTAGTSYSSATTLAYGPQTTSPGNVTVNMTGGGVTFAANANTYTGTTTVQAGTLTLATLSNAAAPHDPTTDSFHAINGNLVIGTGSAGGATTAVVQLDAGGANEAIASTTAVTLFRDATLKLNTNAQTLDAITFNGGTIDIGNGALYLNNTVTVNASAGNTATITAASGALSLSLNRSLTADTGPDAERVFNVLHGSGNTSDLTVSALVQSGSLIKTGAGTMTLTRANEYLGYTSVAGGILNIQVGSSGGISALGTANGAADNSQATFVNVSPATLAATGTSGTLQLQGGITLSGEKLYLAGQGYTPTDASQGTVGTTLGALNNLSGNNTLSGTGTYVVLADNARINSSADLLTISTNIGSTNNSGLTIGGAGNTTISGSINTGTGSTTTLTKDGTGTLILSGLNDYQGATTINAGVVIAQNNRALGAVTTGSAGTTVASGAELQLSNASGNLSIGAEQLTINGAGVGGISGALTNISGNNTYGGQIVLGTGASSSTVRAADGTTLNLTGGITSAAKDRALIVNAGTGASIVETGAVTLGTVTSVAADTTLPGLAAAGISTGTAGTLTKTGAGNFTFGGGATSQLDGITLTLGSLSVTGSNTLVKTGAINSAASTTLTINSGTNVDSSGQIDGGVQMFVGAGNTATLSGTLAGTGILKKDGAGILRFDTPYTVLDPSHYSIGTLVLNGGTLQLGAGVHLAATNIYITGDTILDFGGSANTWLTSANLIISAGVTVTVQNWFSVANNPSASTVWSATNTINGGSLGGLDSYNSPLNPNITFQNWGGYNYTGLTTTWVSGNHDGWFDREIRPTPEPSTYGAIFVGACVSVMGFRRWRRRSAPPAA